jgi:hypothetical protein
MAATQANRFSPSPTSTCPPETAHAYLFKSDLQTNTHRVEKTGAALAGGFGNPLCYAYLRRITNSLPLTVIISDGGTENLMEMANNSQRQT